MEGKKVILCMTLVFVLEITRCHSLPGVARSKNQVSELYKGDSDFGKQCVCMNWRFCEGTINSDVQCPQSYIQVCCVKPPPETNNLPYDKKPETLVNPKEGPLNTNEDPVQLLIV